MRPVSTLRSRIAASIPAALVLIVIGVSTSQSAPAAGARQRTGASSSLAGLGKLAYVSQGRLYILDGATGQAHQITRDGFAWAPTWSPDGHWLAYGLTTEKNGGTAKLWIVRADGTGTHSINGLPGSPGTFRWSPVADVLANVPEARGIARSRLWLVFPQGPARVLAPQIFARAVGDFQTFAWSPDGKEIAVAGVPAGSGRAARGRVYTVDVATGVVTLRYALPRQAGISPILLAGWWPDGNGLLYWVDPMASASIMADGLTLYSLDLSTDRPRRLADTLVYNEWVVPAPRGNRILLVAGGSRPSYYGKHLMLCPEDGTCRPVVRRRGVVSLDPAWAPDGQSIAYVDAKAHPGAFGFASVSQLWNWIASHTLWISRPDGTGAHPLPSAGKGVQAPQWSRDGRSILFARNNALWYESQVGVTAPVKVAQPFPPRQIPKLIYYGHVAWDSVFAWYSG